MANLFVTDNHPIATTKLYKSFRWGFGWMKLCSKQEEEKHDHEMELIGDDKNKKGESDSKELRKLKALKEIQRAKKDVQSEANKDDPIQLFGIGIVSYRNTLFNLFVLFAIMSLVSIPMKAQYKKGGAIGDNVLTKYGKESISNLGYASVQCDNVPYGLGKMFLSCPYG